MKRKTSRLSAFIRVGDKSKKLDFNDRMTLMYAKGVRYYEDEPVADASIQNLDMDFVGSYRCIKKNGYKRINIQIYAINML